MGRPSRPVELPKCTCEQHTCEIHGAWRRRTLQRVNRWYRQGKISREAYEHFRGVADIDESQGYWRQLNDVRFG